MSENQAANIAAMTPREHVRHRPGMYFGGDDKQALHYMFFQVLNDSIEEALYQKCDRITVILHPKQSVTIQDNGESMDVTRKAGEKLPRFEAIMTQVGPPSGRWYDESNRPQFTIQDIGMAAVNAVCAELTAEVRRDSYVWQQRYREGNPISEIVQVRPLDAGEST